jgi:hypothetical protein
MNTSERGAPPSRPPTGPAGPRGLEVVRDDRGTVPPGRGGTPRGAAPGRGGAPDRGGSPNRGGAPGRNAPPGATVLGGATPTSRGPRRLAPPKPVRVSADRSGRPQQIGGRAVEAVRESWLVEDRWWTEAPLRRRYWEVVTADGRDLVVFRDLEAGRWFAQR